MPWLPAALVCIAYGGLVGYRHDYLGHYAAGYGASLAGMAALLGFLSLCDTQGNASYQLLSRWIPVPATGLCILAGTVAEATVFRLARFDEIDWCNQSLGAVMAGLAIAGLCDRSRPADYWLTNAMASGLCFLLLGSYYAIR